MWVKCIQQLWEAGQQDSNCQFIILKGLWGVFESQQINEVINTKFGHLYIYLLICIHRLSYEEYMRNY